MHFLSKVISCILIIFLFTGCASHSYRAAMNLDASHPKFETPECQSAIKAAETHENIKYARTLGTPVAIIATGGILAIPLIVANGGSDVVDNVHSSELLEKCSDKTKSNLEIATDSSVNVGLSLATGGLTSGLKIGLPSPTTK